MLNTLFEAPRKRPTLVTIIAALLAVEGLVWLVLGILAFIAVITNGKVNVLGGSADSVNILSVTWLVSALAALFFAWALWTLKRWAFWATLVIELLNILSSVLLLTRPNPLYPHSISNIVVSLIFAIFILACFLISSKVRKAFAI